MKFTDVRNYVKGVLTNSFANKSTLDKLSTSQNGTLLFDGEEIKNNSNANSTINNYSTEETIIGKWIDDKPIYRIYNYPNLQTVQSDSIKLLNSKIASITDNSNDGSNTSSKLLNSAQGNGNNWFGGSSSTPRILIKFPSRQLITSIKLYTTSNWGTAFDSAVLYYSETDMLINDVSGAKSGNMSSTTETRYAPYIEFSEPVYIKDLIIQKPSASLAAYYIEIKGYDIEEKYISSVKVSEVDTLIDYICIIHNNNDSENKKIELLKDTTNDSYYPSNYNAGFIMEYTKL